MWIVETVAYIKKTCKDRNKLDREKLNAMKVMFVNLNLNFKFLKELMDSKPFVLSRANSIQPRTLLKKWKKGGFSSRPFFFGAPVLFFGHPTVLLGGVKGWS